MSTTAGASTSRNSAPSESELDKSVFFIHVMREIDAPIEKVWDALTDLPKYHEWNPFVREMIITDASKKKRGLGREGEGDADDETEQKLAVDRYILMTCRIPSSLSSSMTFTSKPFERVTTVDEENHRLSWRNIDYPSWALRAERWQTLTITSSTVEDGRKTVTRYETWETFDGVLACFVKWFLGNGLKRAFGAMADGLKARCES